MNTQKIYKVGVIGLGHQSLLDHIPAIESSLDTELVAVAELDTEVLENFIKDHPTVVGYTDYLELLKDSSIDFVVIAVPHHLHFQITKDAILHKKHVLKEKPFVTSVKEGEELKELSKKYDVNVMVTLQRRFNPIYATFFQFIEKIGTPYFLDVKYTFHTDEPHAGWRGKKDSSGGCLIDMGYHMVDLIVWYFGLPEQVFADLSHSAKEGVEYDAEDTAHVAFRYNSESSLFGSMLISRSIPPKKERLNVYGSRGSIHLDRGVIQRFDPNGKVQESLRRENEWPSAAQDQVEYFVKVIEGKRENIGDPHFHLQHLAFIEAAYDSVEQHKCINPTQLLKEYE